MKIITWLILSLSLVNVGWALGCSEPITLSAQKGPQWGSRAAINDKGAAAVVWIRSSGPDTYILHTATRLDSDSAWESAQSISESKIRTYFPEVAPNGTYTIVWSALNLHNPIQYHYTKKIGANPWLSNETIHHNELSVVMALIVDYSGSPLILASKPGQSAVHSYYAPNDSTKSFEELPKLRTSDEHVVAPQMVKNPDGKIVTLRGNLQYRSKVSWVKDYYFKFSQYQEPGKWSDEIKIGSLNFKNVEKDKVTDISASINKKEDLAIIWNYFDSTSSAYQLNSLFKFQGQTDEPQPLLINSSEEGSDSSILLDKDGNAVAVWIKPFNKQRVVYAAFKPKESQTWQGTSLTVSNVDNMAEHVQLGFSNDVFVVVWEETDSQTGKKAIWGSTLAPRPKGFMWTPAVQLSPAQQNCLFPSIAFGEAGGLITWTAHVKHTKDFLIQVANLTVP